MSFLISAAFVMPMDSPPLENAALLVDEHEGRILAMGPLQTLSQKYPSIPHHRFDHHVLLPGFINTHTHLELGYLRGTLPPSPFVPWVKKLIQESRNTTPAMIRQSVQDGLRESLGFGVTTIGDISRQLDISRPILREGPIRTVSFGEIQALGPRRQNLLTQIAVACNPKHNSEFLTAAMSPHAPYTVDGIALAQIVQVAKEKKIPLCMHLAELSEENEFLRSLHGPLRDIWESLPGGAEAFLQDVPLFEGGPIRWAQSCHLLQIAKQVPVLFAHVNYVDDQELDLLAQAGVFVAYCPRTRNFFNHDAITPHRFQNMLARNITLTVATDSLASSPDLSVLREIQFLAPKHPEVDTQQFLTMITLNAACALGVGSEVGSLSPGKKADMQVVAVPQGMSENNVADFIVRKAPLPERVWIDGKSVFAR